MKRNETDIERLFRAHYQEMYHLAKCILMDDAESKDAVSEVFTQLLYHPVVLLPESETGYLMQAVRNRCRNIIAHKGVRGACGATSSQRRKESRHDDRRHSD